jgi:hypothetical protein
VIARQDLLTPPVRMDVDRLVLSTPRAEIRSLEDELPQDHLAEEALQADARAGLSPSQMVERKLLALLRGSALPVSHAQMLYTGMSRR